MEAFLRNVPQTLADEDLRKELKPYMEALKITDWICEKPRRKPQAWIKFLNQEDGRKFLQKHERIKATPEQQKENAGPESLFKPRLRTGRDRARLHILKTAVYVEKSTRPLDKHTINHLKYDREQRKTPRDPQAPTTAFRLYKISCGGNIFHGENKVLTFVEQEASVCSIETVGKFTQRYLTISDDRERADFYNETIEDLIVGNDDYSLTLVLTEPPKMYCVAVKANTDWTRVDSIPGYGMYRDHMPNSLVYRLNFLSRDEFLATLRSIKSRDILNVTDYKIPIISGFWGKQGNYYAGRKQLAERIKSLSANRTIPWPILFQVQALVLGNYLKPSSGLELLDILTRSAIDAKMKEVTMPVTTDAMKILFQRIPYPCPGVSPEELDVHDLMTEVRDAEYDFRNDNPFRDVVYGTRLPDHLVWVFKAMVTPTRVLLSGPDAESRNRVLRMFPKNNDSFLRVMFSDEDGSDLMYNPKVDNTQIYDRYRKVLADGLDVAGRHFSFLGFSHSSLRSHSVWFSAPFIDDDYQQQTDVTILQSLGDFQDIRVPAKCAARIGQAFSETPFAIPLFECEIMTRDIPDVKSADGQRVFSDGVGTISWDALMEIWPLLPMRRLAPTCLQIRWGGYKGMLSLDTRLEGKVFCVRKESMMKFPSNDLMELGICDTSTKPLQLVLNRQMIKILEDMKTNDSWFINLQSKALDVLRAVTVNAHNTSTFLESQAIGVNIGLPKLVKQLGSMGIEYRRDSFLTSAIEHVVLRELRLLKHKARIPVKKGVTLFGVMDETGFLNEGEVYITYDRSYGNNSSYVNTTLKDGPVIVTRSPALHPGDIQLASMATPPDGHALLNLKNCIVFSQKGSRDLPSQLSGGDLDGDLYNVIWDPEAMPKCTFRPADYPRVAPVPLDRPVTRNDIADFFIDFMKTDILGVIATRHVILADYQDSGTLDQACLMLAGMHSTAVDFSKTGLPVQTVDLPKAPRFRPDFLAMAPPLQVYDRGQVDNIADADEAVDPDDSMARSQIRYYKSEKILGRLYRGVDEKKIWNEDIHRGVDMDGPSVWDQLLAIVTKDIVEYNLDIDWTRRAEEAWKIRSLYDSAITDAMWQFSENPRTHLTEVETFCGFILNKRGGQTRRQRDSSIKLKEEIDRIMAWIAKLIRDRAVGADSETLSMATDMETSASRWREDAIELCWACVAIGCITNPNASVEYHGTAELQSFRIVAAGCLLKELNSLAAKVSVVSSGGCVGVRRGRRGGKQTTLPLR